MEFNTEKDTQKFINKFNELEKERLRLERLRTLIALESYNLQLRQERRANRSWYDRLEDTLFDW